MSEEVEQPSDRGCDEEVEIKTETEMENTRKARASYERREVEDIDLENRCDYCFAKIVPPDNPRQHCTWYVRTLHIYALCGMMIMMRSDPDIANKEEKESGYILHAKLCEAEKAIENQELANLVGTMKESKRRFEAVLEARILNIHKTHDLLRPKQLGQLLSTGAKSTEPTKSVISAL
eukprot:2988828-Pyramimonas_sp.AAC.1